MDQVPHDGLAAVEVEKELVVLTTVGLRMNPSVESASWFELSPKGSANHIHVGVS